MGGSPTSEVCRGHGISTATFCNWKDEYLNKHWFTNFPAARRIVETWRDDYNAVRPHNASGNRTPREIAHQGGRRRTDSRSTGT